MIEAEYLLSLFPRLRRSKKRKLAVCGTSCGRRPQEVPHTAKKRMQAAFGGES